MKSTPWKTAVPVFTGLVEEVGTLLERQSAPGGGARLRVSAQKALEQLKLGDSIAVNGVCLTATQWDDQKGWIWFDAVAETLRLTTLERLPMGAPLNLERALAVGDRLGGHYVTGHVDGSGQLVSKESAGNGVIYRFSCPKDLSQQIARKGSITVDGISLTVVDLLGDTGFSVWLVPHTQSATNLGRLSSGQAVNLETDILAKYVHRFLGGGHEGGLRLQQLKEAGF